MQTDATKLQFYQGSDSNAFVPSMHVFSQSGFSEEPRIAFSIGMRETFGASYLAAVRSSQTLEILRDLSEVQFFRRHPSVAQSFYKNWLLGLVPSRAVTPSMDAPSANADSSFRQIENRIRFVLESEPVEDGYTHPAELHLDEIIRGQGQKVGDWLIDLICSGRWNWSLAAGLLRLLSRQKPLTVLWRLRVVQSALSSPDVELRDAAVQAAEAWEDPAVVELLQTHKEPCAWLADYVRNVIRDLTR